MDGIEYRTNPALRITANLRHVVDLAIKTRNQDAESWPDGTSLMDQPERFLVARQIVWRYMDEFEGKGRDVQNKGDQAKPRAA